MQGILAWKNNVFSSQPLYSLQHKAKWATRYPPLMHINRLTLSATLEAGKADNTSYGPSVIINYEDASNLRWTVSGNPTTCNATPNTDWTGSKVPQNYTVSGNPLPAPISVPTKLKYVYQLDCSR